MHRVLAISLMLELAIACKPIDLPAERLWIRRRVMPTRFRTTDSVRIAVTVEAANWLPWPVRVRVGGPPFTLLSEPAQSTGQGFVYLFFDSQGRRGPARSTWGQAVFDFKPWHYKPFTDTVWMNTARRFPMPPGIYTVRTGFGRHEAAPVLIHVDP